MYAPSLYVLLIIPYSSWMSLYSLGDYSCSSTHLNLMSWSLAYVIYCHSHKVSVYCMYHRRRNFHQFHYLPSKIWMRMLWRPLPHRQKFDSRAWWYLSRKFSHIIWYCTYGQIVVWWWTCIYYSVVVHKWSDTTWHCMCMETSVGWLEWNHFARFQMLIIIVKQMAKGCHTLTHPKR